MTPKEGVLRTLVREKIKGDSVGSGVVTTSRLQEKAKTGKKNLDEDKRTGH